MVSDDSGAATGREAASLSPLGNVAEESQDSLATLLDHPTRNAR